MTSQVLLTDKIERWVNSVLSTEKLSDDLRFRLETATAAKSDDGTPRTILFALVKSVHDYMKAQEGK